MRTGMKGNWKGFLQEVTTFTVSAVFRGSAKECKYIVCELRRYGITTTADGTSVGAGQQGGATQRVRECADFLPTKGSSFPPSRWKVHSIREVSLPWTICRLSAPKRHTEGWSYAGQTIVTSTRVLMHGRSDTATPIYQVTTHPARETRANSDKDGTRTQKYRRRPTHFCLPVVDKRWMDQRKNRPVNRRTSKVKCLLISCIRRRFYFFQQVQ